MFESSLWDLKLSNLFKPFRLGLFVWKFPMGFETEKRAQEIDKRRRFESSLWDLKQAIAEALGIPEQGLKVPYGIWNPMLSPSPSFGSSVWKFPMGFETFIYFLNDSGGFVWKFPMGFETCASMDWIDSRA